MANRLWNCHALGALLTILVPTAALGQAPAPADVRARAVLMGITGPLSDVPVPDAVGLDLFVQDRAKLLVLGKALFWDQQLGSDGTACASCHFHAGVDNRSKNQLNPGLKNESALFPIGDELFGNSPFPGVPVPSHFRANYQLTAGDFPLRKLSDPANRESAPLSDTNDVVSSQGVLNAAFVASGLPFDVGSPIPWIFNEGGVLVRNVEPRNTPSTINAVFNHRNFWDGRARAAFNGVNPFGELDANATVVSVSAAGVPFFAAVSLDTASLASQAVGPPLSDLEMAYHGATYPNIGRKLLQDSTVVLANQRVAPDDSVLGPYSLRGTGATPGTSLRYRALVEQAFRPTWWSAPGWRVRVENGAASLVESDTIDATLFTVAEYNFPLFFGLALAEYQRTLVSDETRFDDFMAGNDDALTAAELSGLDLFVDPVGGRCVACHGGPELTTAAARLVGANPVARMILGDGRVGAYDEGFYNIGVRPSVEDTAVGGRVLDQDLSITEQMSACVSARYAEGSTVEEANVICEVPRIIAIPFDAAILLRTAAELADEPPDVIALLDQADALLAGAEPIDLIAASEPLFQALALLRPLAAQLPEITPLLDDALLVLPDLNATVLPDPEVVTEPPQPGTRFAPYGPLLGPNERTVSNGAFKTPSLRNVEFTAPYFHNGGQATLEQVVAFYNRGGDFGHMNPEDLDVDILPLGLTAQQQANIVAFLKALTDERVRWDKAPFDHPSLDIPNGGTPGRLNYAYFPGVGVLDDRVTLPEVGAGGAAVPLGTPNTAFANFLQPLAQPPTATRPPTDMDGDLKADILWRNAASGLVYFYGMSGATIATAAPVTTVSTDWAVAGRGDFDGDGKSDILWFNEASGLVYLYTMDGATISTAEPVVTVDTGWSIIAVADIDGDGKSDILWRHSTSGLIYAYLMDGAVVRDAAAVVTVGAEWQIAGTGDFGGDGRSDILWFNSQSGLVYLYEMNGAQVVSAAPVTTVTLDWRVAGVGDLGGDGKADILWHNGASGVVYLYQMDGELIAAADPVTTVASGWNVADVADFDGDGRADILWRHDASGDIYWYGMNGAAIEVGAAVTTVAADWLVVR